MESSKSLCGGAQEDRKAVARKIKQVMIEGVAELQKEKIEQLVENRYQKFRKM